MKLRNVAAAMTTTTTIITTTIMKLRRAAAAMIMSTITITTAIMKLRSAAAAMTMSTTTITTAIMKLRNVAAAMTTTTIIITPNNKTHIIKFRVTETEKMELQCTAKLLHLSLSTLIRRALHNAKIERTVVVAGGGEETLTAVSTLLAQ